jgi:NAD(P)-dependent dehydrogenase (short-subunit alcohol dehydrogenase family)
MNPAGKTTVVTGGASGIGKAIAQRFAEESAGAVVVVDIGEDAARETAEELGVPAFGVGCDVTDERQLGELCDRVERELGPVEVFCANAGIALFAGLDASDAEWKQVMDVNLMAHVFAARRLVPNWLERGEGYFISTASAAGLLSQIGDVTYTVSKHAAVAFAEWLAITYGGAGVRVSCLCPMGVDTPLLQRGLDMQGQGQAAAEVVAATGEPLAPEEVAAAVVAAVEEERFLILPHGEVRVFCRRKGDDHERWLSGMMRLASRWP